MEPTNRPYVDLTTEADDAGTERWAGDGENAAPGDPPKRRPITGPSQPRKVPPSRAHRGANS
jgi:hypothetical protein